MWYWPPLCLSLALIAGLLALGGSVLANTTAVILLLLFIVTLIVDLIRGAPPPR